MQENISLMLARNLRPCLFQLQILLNQLWIRFLGKAEFALPLKCTRMCFRKVHQKWRESDSGFTGEADLK